MFFSASDGDTSLDPSEIIRDSYTVLIENIYSQGIIDYLYQFEVIGLQEKQEIGDKSVTETERITRLLDVMSRKSPRQFACFLTALENSDQGYISDHLKSKFS